MTPIFAWLYFFVTETMQTKIQGSTKRRFSSLEKNFFGRLDKLFCEYKQDKLVFYFVNNVKTCSSRLKILDKTEIKHVFQSKPLYHLSSTLSLLNFLNFRCERLLKATQNFCRTYYHQKSWMLLINGMKLWNEKIQINKLLFSGWYYCTSYMNIDSAQCQILFAQSFGDSLLFLARILNKPKALSLVSHTTNIIHQHYQT